MADTYTQLFVQIIFSPKGRQNLIPDRIKVNVYKYITGIIRNKGQKLFIINGTRDHLHLFIGFSPDIAISDLVRDIKANSSNYINENKLIPGKFSWQKGFGAFTYSKSQTEKVIQYIVNQERHHQRNHLKKNI